jgi:hypothetical protein
LGKNRTNAKLEWRKGARKNQIIQRKNSARMDSFEEKLIFKFRLKPKLYNSQSEIWEVL